MTARIIGIGAYAPEQVVTNQDLTKFLDTNDAWIRERTGIGARHVSTSEGTSALATEAAKRAIADAGISPEEIEIVIVATSSPGVPECGGGCTGSYRGETCGGV